LLAKRGNGCGGLRRNENERANVKRLDKGAMD